MKKRQKKFNKINNNNENDRIGLSTKHGATSSGTNYFGNQ